jgi:hypothetical protein
MRFCPFCSAENADELAVCQSCGRRLPPLPPRRARNAPATGVQLPPRAGSGQPAAPPMRRAGTTNPPPLGAPAPPATTPPPFGAATNLPPLGAAGAPAAPPSSAPPAAAVSVPAAQPPATAVPPAQPGVMVTSAGFAPLAAGPAGLRTPAPAPPGSSSIRETATGLAPAPAADLAGGGTLAAALSPGPAAQRREPAPPDADPAGPGRRRSDQPPATPRPMPSILPGGPRSAPPTSPPAALGATPGAPASRIESTATAAPPPAPGSAPPLGPSGPRPALAPPVLPPAIASASADPPWATGYPRAPAGFGREPEAAPSTGPLATHPLAIDASRARDGVEPPPTRIQRPEALADRPFTPPSVSPVPEIPEPGLVNSARYTVRFARARWQRRGAIKLLGADIKKDTDALDQVLGALGAVARTAKVDGRVFFGENAAINTAEERVAQLTREHNDVDARKAEENSRFVDVERERNTKLGEAERMVDEVGKELTALEATRRGLRDKRKDLERRQKAYLKAAEDADRQAGSVELGDSRQELRRGAEQNRREAAALEPERQDVDRRLAGIERPIGEATAKLDAAKAELDAAKRSLADAREGHTHRLAELDAEQKRKAREIAQAEAEIARRLVTLGTLVNLNRIEDPVFAELYQRIDRLRGAITARTAEIERLTAERDAYDRGNLIRGLSTIGGAILVVIALIVILRAVLR